jgi:hypothetical protein
VAEQIFALLGKIKIIVQIRDPVDRFVSQYRYHLDRHGIADFSAYVDHALQAFDPDVNASHDWYTPQKALSQSLYFDAITNYVRLFGSDSVLVIDYSELKRPARLSRALSRFLRVKIDPASVRSSNESRLPASELKPSDIHRLREFFGDDYDRTIALYGVTYLSLCAPQGARQGGATAAK